MSEHYGRKVVVTTSIKGERMLKDRARGVADRLNVEFVPREGRPIRQISSDMCDVLVAKLDRLALVTFDGLGDPCDELFFHPGMAVLRISRLKDGEVDPMVEAMDLKPGYSVLDCTLGMAADAIVTSWTVGKRGKVVGLEASPILSEVVRYGLSHYRDVDVDVVEAFERIEVVNCNYEDYLLRCCDESYDVVYMDPMFKAPIKSSSSINPIRRWACNKQVDVNAFEEAKRVAGRSLVLKDSLDGNELERLRILSVYGRSSSSVEYGVLRRTDHREDKQRYEFFGGETDYGCQQFE